MNIVQSISKYDKKKPIAITIGTFDGVHIGHKKIIKRLINNSKELGLVPTVLTFFPHPRMVLQKDAEIKLLNTIEERGVILKKLGLEQLIVHPFTIDFSRLSATEFVRDLLVNNLSTKKIIIGYDHRFGRNRNANIKDLIAFGATYNFSVEEIPAQEINEVSVSSTKIRKALDQGDINTANKYLGYHYMLSGVVTKGKELGRKLSFPTANIEIEEKYKLIPKNGVYVVQSVLNNTTVYGMMNIGFNPTVAGKKQTIEVHFFDFNQDLYGQKIQVDILERIRDEQKFESIEALKAQLILDKETSLKLIAN
ncbi:riboflavin kinase/FMN adenylyltransferase [Maribacter vaceletii]|uniref:Riboflavin biosynthesis protein n=1 Tax=Maribacter vaceletii TaxID=1206816 RepID=A0A495ED41_9FLAO|nr:bifunctional riboflavin kinase/FAD synthetase [Maribacter vaceletii]RKR14463.1 riboflavin kinase/FMN adenylyltransferase [Maribacter vaceletii]